MSDVKNLLPLGNEINFNPITVYAVELSQLNPNGGKPLQANVLKYFTNKAYALWAYAQRFRDYKKEQLKNEFTVDVSLTNVKAHIHEETQVIYFFEPMNKSGYFLTELKIDNSFGLKLCKVLDTLDSSDIQFIKDNL